MDIGYLGIDLGGSNITAALMDAQGRMHHVKKIKTLALEGREKVIQRLIDLVHAVLAEAKVKPKSIAGIGVGAPGIIDVPRGMVLFSPNLPGWKKVPLQEKMQKALHLPVALENDANVAAYGEKWLGAGRGYQNIILFSLGTGVGGGIILDGKIFRGHRYAAGEVGHITILPDGPKCGCGNFGCVEALASGSAIARRVRAELPKNKRSVLYKLFQKNPGEITTRVVFNAARGGDAFSKRILEETAQYLGIAIASSINLLNPELVIIGGGVARAGESLLRPIRREIKRRAMKDTLASVKVVPAQLGDQAGVIGAAGIAILAKSLRNSNSGRRRGSC